MIYLDHNATSPMKADVIEEMMRVMSDGGNPSSVHQTGRRAKSILEKSRQDIARMVNCRPQKIIFTGGGTEANNLALNLKNIDHLIISATEHDSILQARENFSGKIDILPVNKKGLVSPDDLKKLLGDKSSNTLVSIMLGNNETGVIQDIKTLSQIAHDTGALFHTDAIQAFGKIPLDFRALGVDMMTLSAHKINGPQGVGALIAKESLKINPLIKGGGQEVGRRSGTENLAGIAGFAKAASLCSQNLGKAEKIKTQRDYLEQALKKHAPDVCFFGDQAERLPNTSTILMPTVSSETQVMAFDLDGICVSSGSACSSGKVKPSHVVTAMGGRGQQALSTIRVSLGCTTTDEHIEAFIQSWIKLYDRKKASQA